MIFHREKLEQLTPKEINKFIDYHQKNIAPQYIKRDDYYGDNHRYINSIVNKRNQMNPDRPNHKIISQYPKYITDIAANYFVGEPVTYKSANKQLLDTVKETLDNNLEMEHDLLMAVDMGKYGVAMELLYLDENGEINMIPTSPINTILIMQDSKSIIPQLAITYNKYHDVLTDKTITGVELYYGDRVEYYTGDSQYNDLTLTATETHEFGYVPVNIFKNNRDCRNDFDCILTQLDTLELRISDMANAGDIHANTLLIAKISMESLTEYGMDENGNRIVVRDASSVLQDMKRVGNIIVPPEFSGDFEYISPTVNIDADKYNVEYLTREIHKISQIPDLSDSNFAGTQSGEAMKYKMLGLEQKCKEKENGFRKGLYNRIQLILNVLSFKGYQYDKNEIEIVFTRALPNNILETAEAISKLNETGLLSRDTLIAETKMVKDVEKEKELIAMEQPLQQPIQQPIK